MPQSFYIIDGHAQIYRAYYAPFRPLTSPAGEPTRATYVFSQMLLNLIRDRRPDYLVMVMDADESLLQRRTVFPEYKAQRQAPPEDLPVQEDRIVSILQTARVPLLRQVGWEADDLIASLACQLAEQDFDVFVVSRDKDLEQLITPKLRLYDPMKDEVVDAARLFETKGWTPAQAVDAQILTGDSVDNVPGVPGIGAKTAAKLLQKYGTLANVLEHLDELPPKQAENLRNAAPQMEIVRQLVTLACDVPLDFDLARAACEQFDWGRVRPIFEELGFRRLVEQLPAGSVCPEPGGDGTAREANRSAPAAEALERATPLFDGADAGGIDESTDAAAERVPDVGTAPEGTPPAIHSVAATALATPDGGDYRLINTLEGLTELAAGLAAQPEFALDTETTGRCPMDCDLVGVSFAWEVGRGYYVPVQSIYGPTLPLEQVREALGPILANPRIRKIGQNLKYDLNVLRNSGMPVAGPQFDTMIAAFLVEPLRTSTSLDSLAFNLLGHRMIPISDLIGKGRDQLRMDQVPLAHLAEYAGEDADYTWRLRQLFEPQLAPLGVDKLFYETEMPLVEVLADMEAHGVALDVEFLRDMGRQLASRTNTIADEIHNLVGFAFNLDSPKQLAEVLFDKLCFRVVRKTRTTRSTDADTLEVLARETEHPVCNLLLEYRELQKLRGTYVDALPGEIMRRTGRVHTSYHQTGAVTGRLSSSEPNLQNIPIRTELGRQIRRAFVPRSRDELLIVADYSQIELRVLAHFCRDEALQRAFAADQDIHAFVAAEVNGVPLAAVTKDMRARAKAVNFGIVYGQTAFGLAQATGMSRGEAQAFIEAYFARYPRIREFIDGCIAGARRDGHVRTLLGRMRPIEGINSRNQGIRAQAERFAVNTVIQGSAADLIKTAMIQLHRRMQDQRLPLRMLLQVHDELVCEAPRQAAEPMTGVIREVMANAMRLSVPLKVDVAIGENWLQAK